VKELRDALLSAFPTDGDLRRLLEDEFTESLDKISIAPNLEDKVDRVLIRFQTEGRLGALVAAAYRTNPGNPLLAAYMKKGFDDALTAAPAPRPDGGGEGTGRLARWRRVVRDWRTWVVVAVAGLLASGAAFWGGWKTHPQPPVEAKPACRPEMRVISVAPESAGDGLAEQDIKDLQTFEKDPSTRGVALILNSVPGARPSYPLIRIEPCLNFVVKRWKALMRRPGAGDQLISADPEPGTKPIKLPNVLLGDKDLVIVLVAIPFTDPKSDLLLKERDQSLFVIVEAPQ